MIAEVGKVYIRRSEMFSCVLVIPTSKDNRNNFECIIIWIDDQGIYGIDKNESRDNNYFVNYCVEI